MRVFFSYSLYPMILIALGGAVKVGLDSEVEPTVLAPILTGAVIPLCWILERLLPWEVEWTRPKGDRLTDLCHGVITGGAVEWIRAPFFAFLGATAVELSTSAGVEVWPRHWPLLGQLSLAFILIEFGAYWLHRLQHQIRWLWRLHSIHHSSRRLYWLNALRFHPGDSVLSLAFAFTLILLAGPGQAVLTVVLVVGFAHMLLQHSNIDFRLGYLDWVIASPALHRWHHSRALGEQAKNLGGILIIWDVVFKTRYLPKDRPPPVLVGLEEPLDFPQSYWRQLASPFSSRLWPRQDLQSGGPHQPPPPQED